MVLYCWMFRDSGYRWPRLLPTLVEITAGHGARRRLTELGLTPGVELQVIQDEGGPLLLAVHDSRLALGRGMAHKIMVQTV
ncbi:MAG: hypothetical protein B6243_12770 [Anaerolineaceae bacterium 4572_5.2]|nr:MAG: hypothetical protein B6243_12770 [Anaerolineaceae bacterium 4572_5.2]